MSPGAARRAFLVLTATRWFQVGLVVGITTLWPLERGLTIAEALSASALGGLVVFVLELPTSGFADAFGRRPVYLAASVVQVIAAVVFFTATMWWQFALAGALFGVFRAWTPDPWTPGSSTPFTTPSQGPMSTRPWLHRGPCSG